MSEAWTAQRVRQTFLDFFQQRGHLAVSSAPMVLKDDPSLMFTNAGMNQFKDAFLGHVKPPHSRVVDTQKCLRVSGKHNDLEEVGHDTYHHTMFEMLGNWSFGDFFKAETIAWSWELLTEVYGLDKDRLYVTVFCGDQGDQLGRDKEAATEWQRWIAPERILDGDKSDNFWEMGATGPCGPCSEIHIDLRSEAERQATPGQELVNQDHPLVVELWNLVFMEYQRMADGRLERLPFKNVDTGMGFERLCMALQGVYSNYDTDVFTPLLQRVGELSQHRYGQQEETDTAMRVVADHVRAVAFAIADGQLPANNGAGYVIRRILRRAIRYGYSYLQQAQPFIYRLVDLLQQEMGRHFPELESQQELIEKVIKEEEQSFLRTLEQGLQRLEQILAQSKGKAISGSAVFELYDTYGFPPDLTALILKEKGYSYDEAGYHTEMRKQKERARAATQQDTEDWEVLREDDQEEFVGYDQLEAQVQITRYREVKTKKGRHYQLVFNLTPFYPEGGGQVGDSGELLNGEESLAIFDTKKEHGLIVHLSKDLPQKVDAPFKARVNQDRRHRASLNHSATHLLHQALRSVLGTHVAQKGSLVHPDYLRFDFSHFSKLSAAELRRVEDFVNERILENLPRQEFRQIPQQKALEMGALALFGEKYGDTVRAIQFGDSLELCGGIHVEATGQIGLFTLTSEGAVASGVRRVEALTGHAARAYLNVQRETLNQLSQSLKNPKDLSKAVEQLKTENTELRKLVSAYQKEAAQVEKQAWKEALREKDGMQLLLRKTHLAAGPLKEVLLQLRQEQPQLVAVVATEDQGKAQLAVALGDEVLQTKNWQAGRWIKELAAEIRGGGGGQPQFAMAGGSYPAGIEKALEKAQKNLTTP
ncbi:MAG: alanine--tRNA ligase [Schleiferiaceae bacterium]|nr:alanine--tRNA ligase [Schleiferiaceae bacterium]